MFLKAAAAFPSAHAANPGRRLAKGHAATGGSTLPAVSTIDFPYIVLWFDTFPL